MAYDLGTAHGKIELEYTGKEQVDRAQHDIDDVGKSSKKTDKDVKKLSATFKKLGKSLASLGKISALGVGLIQVGAAAGNAVVQLLGIVPALTSILSLSAAIPGAFVGIAAAVGVMKAAFAGVGDAVKAAFETDPAKFEKAIKNLAPAAQDFAKAIRAAAPELTKFQQGLQQSFFEASHLADQVPRATKALAQLKPSLNGLASLFGETTRQVSNFALSADSVAFLTRAIDTFKAALAQVLPNIVPLLGALRSVGDVGLPLLAKMGVAVDGLAEKFTIWLSAVASDGRLQSWIDTALATLKTLGTIAQNVGGILQTVFATAAGTGGGLLNTLASITGAFNEFLKSAAGKSAITSLFTGLAQVAGQLSPVITKLAGALAGALGPAFSQIAQTVGPQLLKVVEALTPALAPVAKAIADILGAVAPLIPPVAQLVSLIATQLATGLSALASELGPVIGVLGGAMLEAFQALVPVVQAFAQNLPLAAQLGSAIAKAFAPVAPLIVKVATTFADALLPVLPQLLDSMQKLVPAFTELATVVSGALQQGLTAIIPLIPVLVNAFVQFVPILVQFITVGIKVVTFLVKMQVALTTIVGAVLGFGQALISGFTGAITGAYNAVVTAGAAIIGWFTSLPGRIGGALAALPGTLVSSVSAAVKAMAFTFGQEIGLVISFVAAVPGRVASALSALGSTLVNLATNAWNAVRTAFATGIAAVVGFAQALPGRARAAISALPGQIVAVATAAWNAVRNAFNSGISSVTNVARSLPGKVKSAVGNLGSLLVGAGRDVVLGLARGISGAVGAAVSAAASVGKQVINGVKSTLHISSPSRVMVTLGRFINQGLINGLTGTAKQVRAAANRVANSVNDAFSSRVIKKSQKNSVLNTLNKGTKQLTALSNKAVTVAGKLKTAQASLTAVQKSYADAQAKAAQSVKDSFSIIQPGKKAVNLESVKASFAKAVAQAKQFAADIQTLAKRGLNKDLIAQIANAGVADGGVMAKALATASAEDIKTFNSLQSQLGTAANSVGKATADALYGAGVRAAQGLVNGLKSQQKAIDKQMDQIAKKMAAAIKKALKIKSPSRVMFQLGEFISRGLTDGIKNGLRAVVLAGKSLANAAVAPTVALPALATTSGGATVSATTPTPPPAPSAGAFGPYNLVLDGKVLTAFIVDAVTGNPTVVSKATTEGTRQTSWAGSGRTA